MLSWFASNPVSSTKDEHGEKTKDDVTGTIDLGQLRDHEDDDAPETPAPVFALRAFKHAIYGTPKTEDRLAAHRRQRRLERERDRARKTREQGTLRQPSTSSGIRRANEESRGQDQLEIATPSKGILLTPGASAISKRKTVSFNARHTNEDEDGNLLVARSEPAATPLVADLQSRPLSPLGERSRTKNSAKGPHGDKGSLKKAKITPSGLRSQGVQLKSEGSRSIPSSFPGTDNLRSSSLAHQRIDQQSANQDLELELAHPSSVSGRYWKQEYESFRSTSEVQMRKVLQKVQLAKRCSKTKEAENNDLRNIIAEQMDRINTLEKLLENRSRFSTSNQEVKLKEKRPTNLRSNIDPFDFETQAEIPLDHGNDDFDTNPVPLLTTTLSSRDVRPTVSLNRSRRSSPDAQSVPFTSKQIKKANELERPHVHSDDVWANFAAETDEKSNEQCINIESISPAKRRLKSLRGSQSVTVKEGLGSMHDDLGRPPLLSKGNIGNRIPSNASVNHTKQPAPGGISNSDEMYILEENTVPSGPQLGHEKVAQPEQEIHKIASSRRNKDLGIPARERVKMRRGARNGEHPSAIGL